jgi:hypothetical protein
MRLVIAPTAGNDETGKRGGQKGEAGPQRTISAQ